MTIINPMPAVTYPGDISAEVGQVVGPNLFGELLVIDAATYDPATDTTTAEFRYALQGDVQAELERHAERQRLAARFLAAVTR